LRLAQVSDQEAVRGAEERLPEHFSQRLHLPGHDLLPGREPKSAGFLQSIDVYLDAVFFPRIARETFEQEGWHYEMESTLAPLSYKGVVFNEMKGNYSSPDNMLQQFSKSSLYPDITYGLDSGGDPRSIPDLSYEQFRAFHARHYHPSNARLFFYGDDDPNDRLRRLDDCLGAFHPVKVDSAVGLQSRFGAPKRFTHEASNKAMITVNWMFDEVVDVEQGLAFDILNYILTGTPGFAAASGADRFRARRGLYGLAEQPAAPAKLYGRAQGH
jgi:Zn-dependent M16 (insulinase) family peptidase